MNHTMLETVYAYICDYINANEGLSPSITEIAKHCHSNVSTVSSYLNVLEAQGRIHRKPGVPRSIRVSRQNKNTFSKEFSNK